MRISAPPFRYPCFYGTDVDSGDMLIACKHTVDEIRDIIGVDTLGYLTLEDAKHLGDEGRCRGYCTACFNGEYPVEMKADANKNKFEKKIFE